MVRADKLEAVESIKGYFEAGSSAIFLDYKGMTVEEVSNLRGEFRSSGVVYKVLKNSLVKRALSEESYSDDLASALIGMTGVAFSGEEPGAAAKIVKAFAKTNDKLKVKAGLIDGQVLDTAAVNNQLATLPSKDEARASFLATLMAPAQQFVMLINTPAGNFVRLLDAKARKGE